MDHISINLDVVGITVAQGGASALLPLGCTLELSTSLGYQVVILVLNNGQWKAAQDAVECIEEYWGGESLVRNEDAETIRGIFANEEAQLLPVSIRPGATTTPYEYLCAGCNHLRYSEVYSDTCENCGSGYWIPVGSLEKPRNDR